MEKTVILNNIKNFSIEQIAESGQAFRWEKSDDGSYIIVAFNKAISVVQDDNQIIIKGIDKKEYEENWKSYFALDQNYLEIIKSLNGKDDNLDKAIDYGKGIRILNQDLWEIIISFIISANNNIPRIKNSIAKLSEKYGKFLREINGKKYYSFPTPIELSKASIDDLRSCGLGYRDKYIYKTTKKIINGEVNLDYIKEMNTQEARKELKKLTGVGNKVADCILLFSCKKMDVFPVDTWVKKILKEYYQFEDKNIKSINKFVKEYFGDYPGIAQQYLFYYIRETS